MKTLFLFFVFIAVAQAEKVSKTSRAPASGVAKGNDDFFESTDSHCYSADGVSQGFSVYPVLMAANKKQDGVCPTIEDLKNNTFVCQTKSWGRVGGGSGGGLKLETKRGLRITALLPQGQDSRQMVTPRLGDNLICIQQP